MPFGPDPRPARMAARPCYPAGLPGPGGVTDGPATSLTGAEPARNDDNSTAARRSRTGLRRTSSPSDLSDSRHPHRSRPPTSPRDDRDEPVRPDAQPGPHAARPDHPRADPRP